MGTGADDGIVLIENLHLLIPIEELIFGVMGVINFWEVCADACAGVLQKTFFECPKTGEGRSGI